MIKKIVFPLLLLTLSPLFANTEADFFRACLNGDRERVIELCEAAGGTTLIFSKDKDSNTGLHVACCPQKGGSKESIVAFLISKGPNVNAQNCFNSTPLTIAVCNENYEAVKLLLKCDEINPNLQDHLNYSPLHYAVINRSLPMITLLLSHPRTNPNFGTSDGAAPLHFAAMYGYKEEAKALIDDARTDLNVAQHDPHYGGATPLHFAAMQAQSEIIAMMIERGGLNVHALILQGVHAGFTPLHFAVMNPDTVHVFETVKLLLQAGANPKRKSQIGKTPSDLTEVGVIKSLLKNSKVQSTR